MLFPTIEFFVFFILVFTGTWALNSFNAVKKLVLLAASYFFYAQWNVYFIFLLVAASCWNFAIGYAIARLRGRPSARAVLAAGVIGNLGLLGYFKYYDFVSVQIFNFFALWNLQVDFGSTGLALPVAISFLAFHGISYIVDVHREKTKASNSLVDVMLYMAFFPHLVAGPIVRAAEFMPQLATPRDPASIKLGASLVLIIGGLIKKVVIAGHISQSLVDPVFVAPGSCSSLDLFAAAVGYAVVIYCDFSGYTDIAIGVANLLGYEFPPNFAQPYRALSLQEFWRRWHITLSNWLKDYVYIPLGGSHKGVTSTYRNLILTMVLGGLWHGAGAQFLIWGGLHGVGLAVERFLARNSKASTGLSFVEILLRWTATFGFVTLAWIFFRASSLDIALEFISGLASSEIQGTRLTPLLAALVVSGMLLHLAPVSLYQTAGVRLEALPAFVQSVFLIFAIWCICIFAPLGVPPFIYFQF